MPRTCASWLLRFALAMACLALAPILPAHAQQLVADIAPGSASSTPAALTDIGGTLYFGARNGAGGVDLYRSDGTTTTAVTDLHAHPQAALTEIVPVGDQIFFSVPGVCDPFAANGSADVSGLWHTDGTTAGSERIGHCRNGNALSPRHGCV